jgi:hypothetical protein
MLEMAAKFGTAALLTAVRSHCERLDCDGADLVCMGAEVAAEAVHAGARSDEDAAAEAAVALLVLAARFCRVADAVRVSGCACDRAGVRKGGADVGVQGSCGSCACTNSASSRSWGR